MRQLWGSCGADRQRARSHPQAALTVRALSDNTSPFALLCRDMAAEQVCCDMAPEQVCCDMAPEQSARKSVQSTCRATQDTDKSTKATAYPSDPRAAGLGARPRVGRGKSADQLGHAFVDREHPAQSRNGEHPHHPRRDPGEHQPASAPLGLAVNSDKKTETDRIEGAHVLEIDDQIVDLEHMG